MSYYHWLGQEAEKLMSDEEDRAFFRNEVIARQAENKPEADGWITLHPKTGSLS